MPSQPLNDETSQLAITEETERAIEQAKREGKFIPANIWEILRARKAKGQFNGEIETIIPKRIVNLTGGAHYFEIENLRTRSLVCTSCAVRHGCILEAHLLGQYKLENGVLYFKGKAVNKTP